MPVEHVNGDTAVETCDVCGHARSRHDAVADRFCRASRDRALGRSCICPARGLDEEVRSRPTGGVRRDGAPMYGRGRIG